MDVDFASLTPEAQLDLMNMIVFHELQSPQLTLQTPPPFASGSPVPVPPPPMPFDLGGAAPYKAEHHTLVEATRDVIFRMAAMQPIHIDPESVKPPKRRNVRISKDPQSVAARHRRERISERIRILQQLIPGGTKMDTASMLDEAIHYVKFLKTQVQSLERAAASRNNASNGNFASSNVGMNYSWINGDQGCSNYSYCDEYFC